MLRASGDQIGGVFLRGQPNEGRFNAAFQQQTIDGGEHRAVFAKLDRPENARKSWMQCGLVSENGRDSGRGLVGPTKNIRAESEAWNGNRCFMPLFFSSLAPRAGRCGTGSM